MVALTNASPVPLEQNTEALTLPQLWRGYLECTAAH